MYRACTSMMSCHQLVVVVACITTLALGFDAVPGAALRGALKESVEPAHTELLSDNGGDTADLLKTPFGMAFGVALGTAMMAFAGRSIKRTKDEQKRIQQLYDENTSSQQLQKMADAGTPLPSLVVIRGVASADGNDVQGVSSSIDGIKSHVGHIDQPDNAYIAIARMAKSGNPKMKVLTDKVAAQTGIKPEDVPDVADDFTHAQVDFQAGTPLILSEILVDRLSGSVLESKEKDDNGNVKKVTITRNCRNQSYTCFYGRKQADGLHLLDMQGGRIDLCLPSADLLPQYSTIHHGEVPPLFLSTANVNEEFFAMLRKEGLTVQGKHLDMSNLPPSKITTPSTHLSKFIFIDSQSTTDTGMFAGNGRVLRSISAAYDNKMLLWEPLGFYDPDKQGGGVPTYAADPKSEMVSADELMEKAARAADINSRMTTYCEPSFSRDQLRPRRDEENCFRVTELAIPRGCDVTILAKPVKSAAGKVTLVAPNSAEDGADVDNPDAQRYRFRILKGHGVENLLKQRSLNIMQYYGFAVLGAFLTFWAAAGYPGLN